MLSTEAATGNHSNLDYLRLRLGRASLAKSGQVSGDEKSFQSDLSDAGGLARRAWARLGKLAATEYPGKLRYLLLGIGQAIQGEK